MTTTSRQPDQNHVVTVSGVRDACAGNTLATNVTVRLDPIVPLDSLRLTRSPAGLRISWTGCGVLQWSSNLVHWGDVRDAPTSPYSVGTAADPRFFRLRLP